jgi:hypothetical protein
MKNSIKNGLTATVAALALACTSVAYAGEVVVAEKPVEVATTTTAGTISEFSPDTIVVRSETAPEPIRYSYSKTTTYVDEAGAPVSMDVVRSGVPVTVYYQREGDRMIANKVVVRKKTTTTTTTTTRKVDDDDDDDDRD